MNITSKIFIVFALMCVSATVAYSQDCNIYLQRASEMVSQKKYCDAKEYYQAYSKCNADADVSTEIAMCERFCKIRVGQGEEVEPVIRTEPIRENPPTNTSTTTPTGTSTSGQTPVIPPPSLSKRTTFKLGFNGGLVSSTEKGSKILYGGGISVEYLPVSRLGIGLSAGYYAYQLESAGFTTTASFIPATFNARFYFLTRGFQPYAGVDLGLYTIGAKMSYEGESVSASKSYFGLSPVLGLQFKLSKTLAIDINSKYNIVFIEGEAGYNICANLGFVFCF